MNSPLLSVIIPTHNRAELLRGSLESLACQSLPVERYEVVVVDDGSTDATPEVCASLSTRMPLKYFRIENSGISAAKNLGIFASSAPLLFFFDDDDIATPDLLAEHLLAHQRYAEENVAVLGYTTWAPSLTVTDVMHYITDVGQFLFAYKNLTDGQELDFTYFWGGRSSCKRSLLSKHGTFCQEFRFGCEDIDLGYRLSQHGLRVIFNRNAVQFMNRPLTYEEFCRRCELQGVAQVLFAKRYPGDPVIEQYCRVASAIGSWDQVKSDIGMGFFRVRELEAMLEYEHDPARARDLRNELHRHYKWTFNAFKTKGTVRTAANSDRAHSHAAGEDEPSIVRPIVIYQMGKVGSKSVELSLKERKLSVPICHSHILNDLDRIEENVKASNPGSDQTVMEILHGRQLRKTILGTPLIRNRVISLVRDPVARNISAFFENIEAYVSDYRQRWKHNTLPLSELVDTFITRFDHETPLVWFDHQLQPVFGFDIFAHAFPKEQGYAIYHERDCSLLLMKLEKLNQCGSKALEEFLTIKDCAVSSTNIGDNKEYRELYKQFVDAICLPSSYLDRMYESKLARHFYSDLEISAFRNRWNRQSRSEITRSHSGANVHAQAVVN